ncbi:MAG: lytic transglycosylase domain-containing protein [Pyrinomonadaceae bacterium]
MKKFSAIFTFVMLCTFPTLAQRSSGYSFDNLDTRQEVRAADAPTNASAAGKTKARRASQTKLVVYVPPTRVATSTRLHGFTTGNMQTDRLIIESGERNGVDPALLYAIMHQESSFKSRAVSNKGASGLMQLMAGTAARFGVRDRFDPRQNIEGGARYMRFLLDFFKGNIPLALAGYNAGEGAVLRYNRQIPPYRETQEYVRRITRRYSLLRDPRAPQRAQSVKPTEVAALQAQTPIPTTIYERNVYSVRLPDGRLQLVSQ